MNIRDIAQKLNCTVLTGENLLDRPVKGAYVSDLLSDVMGNAEEDQVWITLQTHKNVIAIASLKEVAAVILVKNLQAPADVLETAAGEEVVVLSSPLSAFETAGQVYLMFAEDGVV